MAEKAYRSDNACVTIQSGELQKAYERLSSWSQVTYGVMGLETAPLTGKQHLQCYFEFKNTMRAPTFWTKVNLPGSYFQARKGTQKDASNYCKKGEQPHAEWEKLKELGPNFGLNADFLEWGTPKKQQGERTDLSDIISDIKNGFTERQISLRYVDGYARYLKWVQRMFELHAPPTHRAMFSLAECCANLKTQPINFEVSGWEHFAMVSGPAGIGKTEYALAHFKNPLLVSHIDRLKSFDPDVHDGIVFDDMDFNHWPITAQIHLADWNCPRDINCRYAMAHIPRHTKKIFTCNPDRLALTPDEAILSRCYWVNLNSNAVKDKRKKLVHKNTYGPLDFA